MNHFFTELLFDMYVLCRANAVQRSPPGSISQEQDMCRLDHVCKMYYRVHALFLRMHLTVWTLGQVFPVYTREVYNTFRYGLGLKTMPGGQAPVTVAIHAA